MRLSATTDHVHKFGLGIVGLRVGIDVQTHMSDQPICVRVKDLDFGSVSVDYEKPLEIGAVNHRMRGLNTSNCVNELVRLGVEHLHKPIRLSSKEKSVSVQINGKVVEISLLQTAKWNALNELQRSGLLCFKEKGHGEH